MIRLLQAKETLCFGAVNSWGNEPMLDINAFVGFFEEGLVHSSIIFIEICEVFIDQK